MMLSELPEYNAKIKAGFALGPAVFIGDDFLRRIKPIYQYLMELMDWLEINEFFPKSLADLNHYTCTKDNTQIVNPVLIQGEKIVQENCSSLKTN